MKRIALLGSTGSIGQSTLQVVRHLKDQFQVVALSGHSNLDLLQKQIEEFQPKIVAVANQEKAEELRLRGVKAKIVFGQEGLSELVLHDEVNFVVMAIVGLAALSPTVAALKAKKPVALASKEVLVSAGDLVMDLAKKNGVPLLPIDSEHSALFQCLHGVKKEEVRRLIITASGGPFRNHKAEDLEKVTVDSALNHPTWQMGPKITVDSSTLMNKALEAIEAHYLFDISPDHIEVVIHPQSIIHSMVECIDGSILAQMSVPSMILPIQYAMTYPERHQGILEPFDFVKHGKLEFFAPDYHRFPSLQFAFHAMRAKGSVPNYLNAANEILVDRFLKKEISWLQIMKKLDTLINQHRNVPQDSLEAIFEVDTQARREAEIA